MWGQLGAPVDKDSIVHDGGTGTGTFLAYIVDTTDCVGVGVEEDKVLHEQASRFFQVLRDEGWSGRVATDHTTLDTYVNNPEAFNGVTHVHFFHGHAQGAKDSLRTISEGRCKRRFIEAMFASDSVQVVTSSHLSLSYMEEYASESETIQEVLDNWRQVRTKHIRYRTVKTVVYTWIRQAKPSRVRGCMAPLEARAVCSPSRLVYETAETSVRPSEHNGWRIIPGPESRQLDHGFFATAQTLL